MLVRPWWRHDEAQLAATREKVISGAALTGPYVAMNAAAAVLASCGLLQNSPAVIIGAMLVAMLFGPIVGIAMGLAEANTALLGRALVAELVGVGLVLVIGYAVGAASAGLTLGTEILSRTTPSILDLLIALVGGLAGALTYVAADLAGVVVGVAIATALAPPLTSCGILLARGAQQLALGAFLLFVANITAIAVGAMVVFWLVGHRPPAAHGAYQRFLPRLLSLALFAALGFHLTVTLGQVVARARLQAGIEKTLSDELTRMPGARLVGITLGPRAAIPTAWVVVRTPTPVGPEEVARLNERIERATGTTVSLHVRSVITAETTREGYVYQPHLTPDEQFVSMP